MVDLPEYLDFLPQPLLRRLFDAAEPVPAVPGFRVAAGLRAEFPDIETDLGIELLAAVYRRVRSALAAVLAQRRVDRAFIDMETLARVAANRGREFASPEWETVIGLADPQGRIVVGPLPGPPTQPPQVTVPPFLEGEQVTLFGPPDTERLAIHAMNSLHRRRPDEPALVAELLAASGQVPRWGADDEDSKTPIMRNFLRACRNLGACFDGTLRLEDPARGRTLELAKDGLARPIKRFPGLALPDGSHLLDGSPLPLHLVDFVLHLWCHRHRPQALVFYVPKLENEEEAAYLRILLDTAEEEVASRDRSFVPGATRVLLVFENPRAIFRIAEMAAALGPRFLGGSLGWHDFLASTARLFRHDPGYRIPVKADPEIVIRRIQQSHLLLARTLAGTGALRIGGMYGVLFEEGNERSYRLSVAGFCRDVITQLRRGLDGFWVAHPDFVRVGLALVEAWRRREAVPGDDALRRLLTALLPEPRDHEGVLAFLDRGDALPLDPADPLYLRSVLAADLGVSSLVSNEDPEELRYNVFQAVQYLADWLCGNGCVALPATIRDTDGQAVFVRIMDDLATTERSRWEVWAEIHHGRVSPELFERILSEELEFIKLGKDTAARRIQVRWQGEAARWYPIAGRLFSALVCAADPPEFVTEWALPFTFPELRDAADPWNEARTLGGNLPPAPG